MMPAKYLVLVVSFLVLSWPGVGFGQTEESPSMELLEFLGEWENDDGQWIDPMEMEQIKLPESEDESKEQEKHEN